MTNNTKEKKSGIEEILGEPVIEDFSENGHRARRNLLIFSSVAILYWWTGAKISAEGLKFAGFQFEGITDSDVKAILMVLVCYHLMHFAIIAVDHWHYLRIRLTGTFSRPGPGAVLLSGEGDYPKDQKQSNLYSWYHKHNETVFVKLLNDCEKVEKFLKLVEEEAKRTGCGALSKACQDSTGYLRDIKISLKNNFDGRINESLERFNKRFDSYRNIQKIRWVMMEIGLPLVWGVVAFFVL